MALRPPLLLCLSLLLLLPAIVPDSLLAAGKDDATPTADGRISISFNLPRRTLTGSAQFTLPAGRPLSLACGVLAISGAVLERSGQAQQILKPTADNTLVIPKNDVVQTVSVSWSLTVPEGGGKDNYIEENGITLAGVWHPLPDRELTYRLEALLPDGFTAVSEGDPQPSNQDGRGAGNYSAAVAHPVQALHFAAGPYAVSQRTLANGVILATYFFPEDKELAPGYLDQAATFLSRYDTLIGPYPYPRYTIVENRLPTGYGMPAFTLLGQSVVRLPFIKDTSLGHEILHSWFGNSVQVKEDSGNWCEGLTTYLADQLYAQDRHEGAEYRKEELQRYGSFVPRDNGLTLAAFTNASDSQPLARQVRAVGYDKGSMLFHMLRRELGDEAFFAGVKRFYRDMRFRSAGWDDLEKSFSGESKQDLAGFFDQWLTRTHIPKFIVDQVDVSQKEGRSVITFTVNQLSVEPYAFELPVLVTTRTGDSRHTVKISGRSQEVQVSVDTLPTAMALDPDYDLMRVLRPAEEAPVWSRFMGAANRTVVLPPAERAADYAPLLAMLKEMGCKEVSADKLAEKDMDQGSFLFLGNSKQSLGLFADPGHPASGFTLDVRKNPLAPGQVMVLATSSSPAESAAVTQKLSHYGKYSYLSFADGRIEEKRIAPTERGIRLDLFQSPGGVRVQDIRSFDDILAELRQSRVVYVGETHTDMGVHILQLQILQALYQADPDLAIGMEMFPRSAQKALDDYIGGATPTEREFLKKSGYFKVWGYDYRLYQELIGYARRHHIPIIGLNLDKAVVDQVFADGSPDGLPDDLRRQVPAERNLDLPGYQDRLVEAFASHGRQGFGGKKLTNFIQAQALWDEGMAETIAGYLRAHPGRRMLVIAGTGHAYKDTGIPPRVARRIAVGQSVVSSASYGSTGQEAGYRLDYLLYNLPVDLSPAPKVGVVLEVVGGEKDPARGQVRVVQISPHGKAAEAGLKKKDIILAVDGMAVHDIDDIKIALVNRHPGDTVSLKILREHDLLPNEELELPVELTAPTGMEGMPGIMALPPNHPK